jgi:hypothetical protein
MVAVKSNPTRDLRTAERQVESPPSLTSVQRQTIDDVVAELRHLLIVLTFDECLEFSKRFHGKRGFSAGIEKIFKPADSR